MGLFDRFIFFPDADLVASPAAVGLSYEEANFTAADGASLHGWYVPGARAETLLWFHGNAGNISHRLENLRLLHDSVGVNAFLFDYRGYGRSSGTPSEAGLYLDARAAVAHLRGRARVDPKRMLYFGRSLGSAVAVDLAVEDPPAAMILETPFLSIREMAKTLIGPLAAAVPSGFDNLGKIGRVRCPLLFIHGDRDEVVPYAQGRRLFEAASPPKAFYRVRGAGHNDTYLVGAETYFTHVRRFVDRVRERP
jgi:fermentation-respiration switch protein FrsA (DUF1100 family)